MRTTRGAAILAPVLVLVGACAAGGSQPPSTVISPSPSTIPIATVPASPTVTEQPTPTPTPDATGCPTGSPLTPRAYLDADPTCFAGRDVEIIGYEDGPPAMGWEGPGIEPSWLAYPPNLVSTIWSAPPLGPERECSDGDTCAWFFVHVPPGSALDVTTTGRWVIVTGHRDDPLAQTCHFVYEASFPPSDRADDQYARGQCADSFVMTAIRPTTAPGH